MKPCFLTTDPYPVLLQIYRNCFPNFGFEVVAAHGGMECLDLLREFAPDALVLSLELMWGGADGVLSIIREEERWRPIPAVLIISDTSRARAVRHLLPPVVKLLEKPFRLRHLPAIVEAELRTGTDERPISQKESSTSLQRPVFQGGV